MHAMHVIVGTAGHIDHGKTTLIQRLTGVNTDRLPEETKRGITIVLGFAPLVLNNGLRVGVVDVPGHERFVKNMVAGAGGIDVALLVVAADEGVMPQTREHLEICQLLGIRHGVIALTKIDKAGEELTELAIEDVRSEMEGTFFESAPLIPCSSKSGEGIEEVKAALTEAVSGLEVRRDQKPLLLPVDRSFSMKGFGSVITGTLLQGTLNVGDTVDVLPPVQGRELDKPAKVRGIQVFKDSVERAYAGQRTAVNLQGIELERLGMGQVLVRQGASRPTRKMTVLLQHLKSRSKKLKSGAQILLHTGTALVPASVTLLEHDALEPGESGYATVRMRGTIATLPGQRFIARGFESNAKAGRTIAGGLIVDPQPGRRRRKDELVLSVLSKQQALIEQGPEEDRLNDALIGIVQERGAPGIGFDELVRRLAFPKSKLEKAARSAPAQKALSIIGDRAVDLRAMGVLQDRIIETVTAYHKEFPFRQGIAIVELTTRLGRNQVRAVVDFAARKLTTGKRLVLEREGLRLPSHRAAVRLDGEAKQKLMKALLEAGLEPPATGDLEKLCGLSGASFKELMAALVRAGEIVHAGKAIYFSQVSFDKARAQVLEFIRKEGGVTTAQAKEFLGISRKYLIPLLETMDKRSITVRVGEVRKAKVPG